MRSAPRAAAALLAFALLLPREATAQDPDTLQQRAPSFTVEQLDSLLAPVALYPDPLLAQVLIAATFPDQIHEAAAFVRANGTDDIDAQGWDVSVKAVAHYPPVLNRMAERLEWTTELGQAYAAQSSDVMDSVQRLRQLAAAHGNLHSTAEQEIVVRGKQVTIEPAQPTVIYVPTYDPGIVFVRPIVIVGKHHARFFSFGIGFPIGVWLNYDCDWFGRRVFYHGWKGLHGWRGRSRPFIHLNDTYVNPRFVGVPINRDVLYRPVSSAIKIEGGEASKTVNRTVFYSGNRSGPTVYRSAGGTTSGSSAGSSGRTVFPRDLRGSRAPTSGSYRGVIRGAGTKSGPVIYRGQSRPSGGGSYRGVQKPSGGTTGGRISVPRMGGIGTGKPSTPRAGQGTRPSTRGFGTISPPKSGSIKPATRPPK